MTDADEQADPAERGPTDLDGPPDDEDLYEIPFGEPNDDLRPVCQGDVYAGICLPTYDGEHDHVLLATHPCSMRAGPRLRPRIQAFAVGSHQHVAPSRWPGGFKKVMPLPALTDTQHRAGRLVDTGPVTPEQLANAARVATLSHLGILLLQQRIIWTLAHTVVRLDTLAEHTGPALAELELLEHWNEEHCAHLEGEDRVAALAQTAQDFEDYITDDLRGALASPQQIAAARIQIPRGGSPPRHGSAWLSITVSAEPVRLIGEDFARRALRRAEPEP